MPSYRYYGDRGVVAPDFTRYMTSEQKEALRSRRNSGLRKIRVHGLVQLALAVLCIGSGIAVLVVAGENVAFPTFNFGPVIVGLVFLFGGILGWQASQRGLDEASQDMPSAGVRCFVCGHFAVCVTCISLALVSAAFSLVAAGVCFDPNEVISKNKRGEDVNLSEACEPNKSGNAVAGLVAGVVCLLIALWSIFGTCFFCCYGRSFGFTSRRQQMRQMHAMDQRISQLEMQGRPPPAYSTNQQFGGPAYNKA